MPRSFSFSSSKNVDKRNHSLHWLRSQGLRQDSSEEDVCRHSRCRLHREDPRENQDRHDRTSQDIQDDIQGEHPGSTGDRRPHHPRTIRPGHLQARLGLEIT